MLLVLEQITLAISNAIRLKGRAVRIIVNTTDIFSSSSSQEG